MRLVPKLPNSNRKVMHFLFSCWALITKFTRIPKRVIEKSLPT